MMMMHVTNDLMQSVRVWMDYWLYQFMYIYDMWVCVRIIVYSGSQEDEVKGYG